jgi:hypothetical protein
MFAVTAVVTGTVILRATGTQRLFDARIAPSDLRLIKIPARQCL